jgi:protein SCO1/2
MQTRCRVLTTLSLPGAAGLETTKASFDSRHSRKDASPEAPNAQVYWRSWMPAFAGMTRYLAARFVSNGRLRERAALVLALAVLVFPALVQAHEAGGDKRLPVIGPAPNIALTSQDGAPVALADLRGKVVAVTFIYTQCPDICPMLTQKMVDIQDELGADFGAKIAFLSITLDPEHDTPEVLKDYAQFWGAKPEGWSFLTGSLDAVRDVTRDYGVFFSKKEDGSVEHSQLTTLVDAEGQIRVQYLGARFDPEEFRHDLMSLVDKE